MRRSNDNSDENISDTNPHLSDLMETMNRVGERPKPIFHNPFSNETKLSESFSIANIPQVSSVSNSRNARQSMEYRPNSSCSPVQANKSRKSKMMKMSSLSNNNEFSEKRKRSDMTTSKRPFSSLLKHQNKHLLENINDTDKKKTFYGVISNFYLTRKFINLLKGLTSKRTPKYLNKYHFDLMNDRTFFYEEYIKSAVQNISEVDLKRQKTLNFGYFSRIKLTLTKRIEHWIDEFGVYDINQTFTMFWNAIAGFAMLFYFIYVPIFACFQKSEIQNFQFFVISRYFCFLILSLDILKRLNTSFYKKGSLIVDRREIVQNYIKCHLFYDCLSLGSLIYQELNMTINLGEQASGYTRFAAFLFYFKLRQFNYIVKKFEEMLFIDELYHHSLALVKLIFRILLLSHIFACMWYILGTTTFYRETWLTHYDLSGQSAWTQYLYAYYYVCVTMNTVGYGDFTPQNPLETVFAIVFIYVACGVFAYSLNSIGIIVSDLTKRSKELSKQLNVINEFMDEKNITFDLRMRVRNYLEYIFKEEKIEKVEEQSHIIKKLSDSIKEELLIEAHGDVIRDVKLFSLNFSEDTLRKTVQLMKEVRYTPGDIIFLQNDYNNKDLYLIRKGVVELFIESDNNHGNNDISIIKRLKEKDMFGEKSFFTNRERSISARSCDFTTVYVISQEDFLSVLKKSSKDFEKFCEIKDNLNTYEDYSDLFVKCTSCAQNTHLIDKCPILHYIPAIDIIIQRHTYNPLQARKEFIRNIKRKKMQTLEILNNVEKKAFLFQVDHLEKQDSEEDSFSEDGNSYKTITQKTNTQEDEEMPEIKEDFEAEEEEKKNNEEDSIKLFHEKMRKSGDSESRKIQRRSTKKTGIVLLKKQSTSHSQFDLNKNFESSNSFILNSEFNLENVDFQKIGDETSSSNSIHSKKKIPSFQSFLIQLIEHLKSVSKKQNEPQSKEKIAKTASETGIQEIASNMISERSFDIDGIKCYEEYYSDGNVDVIIEKVEEFRKKRAYQKKIKRSRSIYNLLNLEHNHKDRNKMQLERSETNNNNFKVKKNIMRRNFFKNARNLEKLIMEDQFDIEKFKAYYTKRYEKEQRIGCFTKFKRWIVSILEKKRKQRMRIAKSTTNRFGYTGKMKTLSMESRLINLK